MLLVILWIGILTLIRESQCLYFTQDQYTLCSSSKRKLFTDSALCDPSTLMFKSSNDAVTVDSNGVITVLPEIGKTTIRVEASCHERGKTMTSVASVDISPNCDIKTLLNDPKEKLKLCFVKFDLEFSVQENIAPLDLGSLSPYMSDHDFFRDYYIENENSTVLDLQKKQVQINPKTSTLTLRTPFDYEETHNMALNIKCQISHGNTNFNFSSRISIKVRDTNDNPPVFQSSKTQIKSLVVSSDSQPEMVIVDNDVANCSQFLIEVFGDPLNVCHPKQLKGWHVENVGTFCKLDVNISRSKKQVPDNYTCNIAVIDTGYIVPLDSSLSDRAILELKWQQNVINADKAKKGNQIQIRVNKNSSRFTKVYKFPEKNKTVYVMNPPKHAFSIISDGTVYVDNPDKLRGPDIGAKVTVMSHPDETETEIFISFVGDQIISKEIICNQSCSRFMTKLSCESGCGFGTQTGRCTWREGSASVGLVKNFATCTPNIGTCPNQECDSLENVDLVCPQDCTTSKIAGPGVLNQSGRGILRATSPCWCNYLGECSCFSSPNFPVPQSTTLSPNRYNSSNKDGNHTINNVRVDTVLDDKLNNSASSVCNIDCKITIATICGCISALACLFFLIWKTRRFKCQKKKSLKHVGSVASMSVIPSDYLDDRDYRMHSSPQCGPYYKESTTSSVPEDAKWEFDRENLQLDVTLGEGEFGKVVKAKAFNFDGKQIYTDVAVKMLKNCASSVEQQALWSEFNLLKDVQHPNVIRLLGACTQNGPIYLIVEYCEHGSLLSYLRNSRLEENGYVNQRYRPSHSLNGHEPPELLTVRDLLSFAWQTAKGMKYLSEIKLVHRDLAARNILVGTGKVLKISDFGLTRDVYEADTYLKQSKGRIPVKWLAPESLYAQIYTTQSDVWSFGIVLWEIVTLGAPPYPGVPPERLYNLLLAGYRMDRPENCSDELYAVMQKCWKADPQDRPTFAKLADIFDKMLQQRTEYLELTGGFEEDTNDLFLNRYAPPSTGIAIVGSRTMPIHSENIPTSSRDSGSSYLTPAPALSNTLDSDVTSLKRDSSEMASLLTHTNSKTPLVNDTFVNRRAQQTKV